VIVDDLSRLIVDGLRPTPDCETMLRSTAHLRVKSSRLCQLTGDRFAARGTYRVKIVKLQLTELQLTES